VTGSTSIWRNSALNSGNIVYIVYIIPKRDCMTIYNYMWEYVDCREMGKSIDCALISDGR
jgi:hypothetical protein